MPGQPPPAQLTVVDAPVLGVNSIAQLAILEILGTDRPLLKLGEESLLGAHPLLHLTSMVICTAHRCPMLRRVYPPFPPSVSAQVTNGLSALSKQDEVIALRLLSPPPSLPPPLHQPG